MDDRCYPGSLMTEFFPRGYFCTPYSCLGGKNTVVYLNFFFLFIGWNGFARDGWGRREQETLQLQQDCGAPESEQKEEKTAYEKEGIIRGWLWGNQGQKSLAF